MDLERDIMAYGHHQASCLSCLHILKTLYYQFLKKNDRFILSKAHASPALYYILADLGYFNREEIKHFPSHCIFGIPGIEFTGGSLGMGLGVACGIALSLKRKRDHSLVVCLIGDGELYEGSTWEAIMFASANRLNNLICLIDRNRMSASDFTENFMPLEMLEDKFDAFNWDVITLNENELFRHLSALRFYITETPICLIVNTVKGRGVDEFVGNPRCHTMKK